MEKNTKSASVHLPGANIPDLPKNGDKYTPAFIPIGRRKKSATKSVG
jgi:hypothetical protein